MLGDRAYPPQEKPFPVETLRHWYVTPFGGRSLDLRKGEVGINSEALDQNTNLVPDQDRVLISILSNSSVRPLYTRSAFSVVALDPSRPDGLEKSPHGEAVLPVEEVWDIVRRPHLQPTHGQPLLLNSVAWKVFGKDPSELMETILVQALRRKHSP